MRNASDTPETQISPLQPPRCAALCQESWGWRPFLPDLPLITRCRCTGQFLLINKCLTFLQEPRADRLRLRRRKRSRLRGHGPHFKAPAPALQVLRLLLSDAIWMHGAAVAKNDID